MTTEKDPTLRESLEASFEKVEAEQQEGGEPTAHAEEPVRTATEEKTAAGAKEESAGGKLDGGAGEPKDGPGADKQGAEGAEGVEGKKPDDKGATADDDDLKAAPSSWKAAERELWSTANPELKRIIKRREGDIQKLIERQSNEGRFRAAFEQTIAPFQKYIKAAGGNPFQTIHRHMATVATLQDGSAHQRAALVTDMINTFKVDVELLDQMLARSVKPKGQGLTADDVRGVVNEVVQPLIGERTAAQQQQQQQQLQAMNQEVEAFFADPANEYMNDVALDVADLMEMAARRGEKMTIKEAYDKACRINPDVQKLVQQKRQAELAKKKAAGSSLASNTSSTRNVPKVTASSSLREDIEASIAALTSR